MFALDLFNTDHERRLAEGAVDQLEQRRIDDLAMKMDDLVARAKKADTPEHKAALVKEFQKCKAERDGYFKIKDECMGYGGLGESQNDLRDNVLAVLENIYNGAVAGEEMIDDIADELNDYFDQVQQSNDPILQKAYSFMVDNGQEAEENPKLMARIAQKAISMLSQQDVAEAEKNQDIADKKEKMARATPSTPTGKVASTVKNAAKWLAGKGGPGREGPTYEGAEDIEDRGEYDQEGDMVKDNLHTIRREAERLEQILSNNENVPEWVQDKLAQVKGMMTSSSEYMQTQRERGHEEATGKEGFAMAENQKKNSEEVNEAQRLHAGDPIVVTAPNEFEGKTGEIAEFSPSGTFVVVDLYNHGRHSMHLSDVKYNDYADQEEEDDWYDDADEFGKPGSEFFPEGFQDFNKVEPKQVDEAGTRSGALNTAQQLYNAIQSSKGKPQHEIDTLQRQLNALVRKYQLKPEEYTAGANQQSQQQAGGQQQRQQPPPPPPGGQQAGQQNANQQQGNWWQQQYEKHYGQNAQQQQQANPDNIWNPQWAAKQQAAYRQNGGQGIDPNWAQNHMNASAKMMQANQTDMNKMMQAQMAAGPWNMPGAKMAAEDGVDEGFQDFNKVEPYEVCLAGKCVKTFDYYEDARRFHDNWKKKLYRAGDKAKADKITLNPVMKEQGVAEAISKKDLLNKVAKDLNTQFKKAKSGKLKASGDFTKGDHWQGAGPDDYGYTGYQGHGMPTDKKKGVKEAGSPAQQAAIAIAKKKASKKPKSVDENTVQIPHKGKMVSGKVVRKDPVSGEYIVDVGEYGSVRVPAHKVKHDVEETTAFLTRGPRLSYGTQAQHTTLGPVQVEKTMPDGSVVVYCERDGKRYRTQPSALKMSVAEDTGSWIVYDPATKQIKKRFKTHTAGKSYARTHNLGFASSEYYFDRVKQPVNELDVNTLKSYADKRGAQVAAMKANNPNAPAGSPEWIKQAVPGMAVARAKQKIARKEQQAGVTESAMSNVHAAMADVYHRLAPKIERHRDSFLAGQLYDELENIAELHGIEPEFKRMMAGARNRAHMDYDTNPGGFQNWFWYLPFNDEEDLAEEQDTNAVESAIIRRIMVAHTDLLRQFGPDKVMQAAEEVAYNVGDVDEIGTSDVSAYVAQVRQILGAE